MLNKWLKCLMGAILIGSLLFPYTYETHSALASAEQADLEVSAEILYLREGPGLSYPILETLHQGQALTFIEKQDDWYHVKTANSEGWVASWLTKSTAASSETDSTLPGSVISQVDDLNVRTEPSLSSAILTQLNTGDEAKVLAVESNWVQISFNDVTGWVSADYVTVNQNEEEPPTGSEGATAEETSVEIDPNLFTITVEEVVVRKKADLTSKKLGTVKKGEQFKVLDRAHNWVKIKADKNEGWVYSFYGTFQVEGSSSASADSGEANTEADHHVTIIYNGTNLREEPSTSSNIVVHANAGETFKILATENDWYQVDVGNNTSAYVADWVVSVDSSDQPVAETNEEQPKEEQEQRKPGTLKGLTIVIDPGHGGNDKGTTGVRGTDEKNLNLKTVELLKSKLRSAGAEVILTRESDVYVDLRKRVSVSHQYAADAFISIHYDATEDSSISGFTTYYTHGFQSEFAEYVHAGIADKVTIRDRGVQPGNYLVTRENKRVAILLELGYLSNPSEESIVTTDYYREQATLGIYQGILDYFDAQLQK